jgi:hypothetical protein
LEGQGKYLISNQHYPQIVTSGMVLNLDAGYTASYPNVGTSWYDLTKSFTASTLTNGPTWSNSGQTSYISFDGSDDYVKAPINLTYTEGTIDCWVYPRDVNDNFFVYTNNDPTFTHTHQLGINSSNRLRTYIYDGSAKDFSGPTPMNLNRWYYCVFWWKDGVSYGSYLNTISQGSAALGTAWKSGSNFWIGSNSGGNSATGSLNGNISKIQIYNRNLTQSEMLQNYYQGPIVTSGLTFAIDAGNLVSYGGAGNTVYDLTTTGVTGTLTNGPTWDYLSGGAFSFDGVDDYVILSSGLTSGTESFTISCFLKYSIPISTTFRDIINNRNISTALSGFLLTTDFSSRNGKIRVQLNNTTTVSSFISTGNKNIADNNWNQVVIVVNRITNLMTFFVNGIQEGDSFDVSSVGDISPGSNLQIGGDLAYNDTKAWFPGNISQVQIYNRALSESEIKQNFEAYRGRFGV